MTIDRSSDKKKHRFSYLGAGCGAVVNEFVLVLPLLLIFFTGLLEFGRALNQISWLSQTTYEAARVGGNSSGPQGQEAMSGVANLYYGLLGKNLEGGATSLSGDYDLDKELVIVTLEDKVPVLLGAFQLDLKLKLSGPHLAHPVPTQSNEFLNTIEHDCTGAAVGFDEEDFCCLSGDCSEVPIPGVPGESNCRYFLDLCNGNPSLPNPPVFTPGSTRYSRKLLEAQELEASNEIILAEVVSLD